MNWVITTTWGDYPFKYVYKKETKTKTKKAITSLPTK